MRRKKVGVKDFYGSVDITAPCYDKDAWCRMNSVKIKDGKYTCMIWDHTEKGTFGGKQYIDRSVGIIGIYLDGMIPKQESMTGIGSIGVDVGMAGFFHDKPDYSEDAWSEICGRLSHGNAWITEDGFFSSSGQGDGIYDVFAYRKNREIVALEIRFL